MRLYIHHEGIVGFRLGTEEPLDVGEEVTLVFRGREKIFRCTSAWQDEDDRDDVAKLEAVSPWKRRALRWRPK